MRENELYYLIRGAVFQVYKNLGPGLLESVYEAALLFELRKLGLEVKSQVGLPVIYCGQTLDLGFRLDILVEDLVIIEIKSIEAILDVHHKIMLTYLRLAKKKLGLIVNFNSNDISKSIIRKVLDR